MSGFLRRRRIVALRWRLAAWVAPPRPPTPVEKLMRQAMDGPLLATLLEEPMSGGAVVYEESEEPCPDCNDAGEITWLANPPDPQTEESMPCRTCEPVGESA